MEDFIKQYYYDIHLTGFENITKFKQDLLEVTNEFFKEERLKLLNEIVDKITTIHPEYIKKYIEELIEDEVNPGI